MRVPRLIPAPALVLGGALALAACGGGSAGESADTLAASPTFETNDSTSQLDLGASAEPDQVEPEPVEPDPVSSDPAGGPPATDAPAEPAAEPVVQPAALGGRAFDESATPESNVETNLLPDLVVDDVGRGTKANLRNVFPAERPVLLWMWAPH